MHVTTRLVSFPLFFPWFCDIVQIHRSRLVWNFWKDWETIFWLKKIGSWDSFPNLEVKGELGSEWLTIVIDEKIPCHAGTAQPRFAQANSREIWVLLMEKAFAKMYGGYDKLEGTCPSETLNFMESPFSTLVCCLCFYKTQVVWCPGPYRQSLEIRPSISSEWRVCGMPSSQQVVEHCRRKESSVMMSSSSFTAAKINRWILFGVTGRVSRLSRRDFQQNFQQNHIWLHCSKLGADILLHASWQRGFYIVSNAMGPSFVAPQSFHLIVKGWSMGMRHLAHPMQMIDSS